MTKKLLAEQAWLLLGKKPSIQELTLYATQAYGVVVQKNWWMNRAEGESTVNGNYIYAFDDNEIVKDDKKNLYYSRLPSSYLGNIPHELGINHVSYMESYDVPFIRFTNGQSGLFRGLDSAGMAGNNTFFVENDRIYLPTIDIKVACDAKLLIKLVVALEGIDEETNIAIPPDVSAEIVQMIVQLYSNKQDDKTVVSLPEGAGNKP